MDNRPSTKKRIHFWLPRALGVLLFVFILYKFGGESTLQLLSRFSFVTIVGLLVLNFPHILAKALRWRALLAAMGGRYGVMASLHAYFAGIAMGIVTPGRAGELFRAAYPVRAKVVTTAPALASVIVDRLFDLGALLSLSLLAALFVVKIQGALFWGGGVVALLLGLYLGRRFGDRLLGHVAARTPLGREGYAAFKEAFWRAVRRPLLPSLLTVTGYTVMNLQVLWIARSMGVEISFFELLLLFSLANTFALLPVSLSGLGAREAALGFLFYLSGRPEQEGITVALAFFLFMALPVTLTGALSLLIPARVFSPSAKK